MFENEHHHYADLRTWLAWRASDDGPLDGPAGPEEFETAADALFMVAENTGAACERRAAATRRGC